MTGTSIYAGFAGPTSIIEYSTTDFSQQVFRDDKLTGFNLHTIMQLQDCYVRIRVRCLF
jgi:hypothetical protein